MTKDFNNQGLLRITVEFSTETTEPLTCLCWGVFHDEVKIDKARQVYI